MKLIELMQECSPSQNETYIQRLAKCESFIGTEIEMTYEIGNIGTENIFLWLYTTPFGTEEDISNDICSSYQFYFYLYYDKNKFQNQLLLYNAGDLVEIKAKLRKVKDATIWCDFDLMSIKKISTQKEWEKEKSEKEKINHTQSKNDGFCFIATACYGNYNSPEVIVLRDYRDNILLKTKFGRIIVKVYYFLSPPFAKLLFKSESLKKFVRLNILSPIISRIILNQK